MPATYTLIASNTLSSSAVSVTFSSISASYTDLVLRISARSSNADWEDQLRIRLSGDTSTNYSRTSIYTQSTTVNSNRTTSDTYIQSITLIGNTATANTFNNTELYIANYAGSANKTISVANAAENNSATSLYEVGGFAALWRNSSAVSSIVLTTAFSANFVSGSSFFLYGIKNS